MKDKEVKGLYALGKASWYDKFKSLWNKTIANKAENELNLFLKGNINKNTSILELGCGTALNLEKINYLNLKFKKYLGIDFSIDMLNIARKKFKSNKLVKFEYRDITKLNNKEKFDIIICTWVLSHLDSPSDIINKSQKLLKNNGKMFIILFSEPKWYLNYWFPPLSRIFFKCYPVSNNELLKFNNVRVLHKYSNNMVTAVTIWNKN